MSTICTGLTWLDTQWLSAAGKGGTQGRGEGYREGVRGKIRNTGSNHQKIQRGKAKRKNL